MFENYKVAVKVSLINEVSAGILMIARQFGAADTAAKAFQARLNSIKDTAKGGALLVGGSMAIAAPFIYAIDKAAELQKQMIAVQVATRGTVGEMDSMRKSIEGIASQTIFSNIDVAKMAKVIASGTGLGAKEVEGLLPAYAKFADVQLLMKGTAYDKSVTDAIRLAHTAQKYDPESLSKYMDLLTKASFIVPGDLGEVGHALKYSQGLAKTALGVDDEQMVLLTALLNRLGFAGSRGGTNLIAAMTRTIPGVFGSGLLTGKSGESLRAMGMVDAGGHSKFLKGGKFDAFSWMGGLSEYVQREFARNPENIAREHIMKNFQHAFGSQGGRVASLLSDPQALEQLRKIGEAFQGYGGVESIQKKFADESVAQQYMNAKTNFVSAMTELGITLLPLASDALKKLNHELQGLIQWITENPGKVKALSYAFLGLSGAMAFGGSIMLLSAGFRGIGMALTLGGGLPVTLTAAATALGVLGRAAAVFAAAYGVGSFIDSATTARLTEQNGGKAATLGSLYYDRMHNADGSFRWQGLFSTENPAEAAARREGGPLQTVKPGGNQQMVQVSTQINMDGRKVAEMVSEHRATAWRQPVTGAGRFDGRVLPAPVGG